MRRILGSHFVDVKRGPGNGSYVFDGVKPYIDCSKLDDTWPRLSNGEKLPPRDDSFGAVGRLESNIVCH